MKPEKVFRFGSISARIFLNEVEQNGTTRSFRNVKLQRAYREGEEWKTSSSFTLTDLPLAMAALQRAADYVADKEAEVDV